MKKIIACISLTLIFILSATASFLVNDLNAYRHWMLDNRPKIMENFRHKDKKGPMPQRDTENPRKDDKRDDHGKDHHEMKRPAPPAAPTPEPSQQPAESPAPGPNNSSEN